MPATRVTLSKSSSAGNAAALALRRTARTHTPTTKQAQLSMSDLPSTCIHTHTIFHTLDEEQTAEEEHAHTQVVADTELHARRGEVEAERHRNDDVVRSGGEPLDPMVRGICL